MPNRAHAVPRLWRPVDDICRWRILASRFPPRYAREARLASVRAANEHRVRAIGRRLASNPSEDLIDICAGDIVYLTAPRLCRWIYVRRCGQGRPDEHAIRRVVDLPARVPGIDRRRFHTDSMSRTPAARQLCARARRVRLRCASARGFSSRGLGSLHLLRCSAIRGMGSPTSVRLC